MMKRMKGLPVIPRTNFPRKELRKKNSNGKKNPMMKAMTLKIIVNQTNLKRDQLQRR